MKRTSLALAILVIFVLATVTALAADCCKADKSQSKPAAHKVVSAVCPVMGTKIPDVTKAAGKSVYKGKTYYFCCKGCKPKFDKDPEKYIKNLKKK